MPLPPLLFFFFNISEFPWELWEQQSNYNAFATAALGLIRSLQMVDTDFFITETVVFQ